MQYNIDNNGVIPTRAQIRVMDSRLNLALSRYNNLLNKCVIKFTKINDDSSNGLILCEITASFNASTHFEISDVGTDINDVFAISINRIKRNIERHLNRRKATRLDNDLSPRTI
jgi:hypothetical protein